MKKVRDFIATTVCAVIMLVDILGILACVGYSTNQTESIVTTKETEVEEQQKETETSNEVRVEKATVLKTINGTIRINEGEDPEKFRYMHDVHTFSKDGYKDEKDLEKSTGYLYEDVKTRWFTVSHYQEQQDETYKEVEQDTCKRLGFLWQDISIEPKQYEGYVYNEKVSCSEITNGLPSSILVEASTTLNPEESFYHTDISFDIKLYYDLVE